MKFENIKYTPTLDRILEKAEEYAHQYQYGTIESAHLLAAMATTSGSIAYSLLAGMNVDSSDLLIDLEDLSSPSWVIGNVFSIIFLSFFINFFLF